LAISKHKADCLGVHVSVERNHFQHAAGCDANQHKSTGVLIKEGSVAHEVGEILQLTECYYIARGKVYFYNASLSNN
jgi:hypothetical protein